MKKIVSSILVLALLLTLMPVALAADAYNVYLDKSVYEVEPSSEFDVPVYISMQDGAEAKLLTVQVNVAIPDGFTATATAGSADRANVTRGYAVFFKAVDKSTGGYSFTKDEAIGTIKLTAPATEGTYDLTVEDTELYGTNGKMIAASLINEISAKVVVKAPASKELTGITVEPTNIENIPYNLKNDETAKAEYVKEKITKVTANYSNGDLEEVDKSACDITTSGTVATVKYLDKTATVELAFAAEPTENKYAIQLGKTEYSVEAGQSVEVPVYISMQDGAEAKLLTVQVNVAIPDGFTATATAGSADRANVTRGYAVFFKAVDKSTGGYSFTKDEAIGTIKLTAPATEGTYDLTVEDTELYGTNGKMIAASLINEISAKITVTGGSTPSEPTLTGISVNPDEVMVPYNQDVTQVIGTTNFSVTAFYDDETSKVLDRLEYDIKISDDGNTATVSYQGKTAAINIKYQPTPVLTVEKSEITVPYGTEDVEAYVKAEIKSGKVKLDETDLTFDDYVIEFTNGADTATVKYAKDENITATVSVKYVELDKINVVIKGDSTEVKIPWDSTDDVTAVKALITVTAVFTNGAHDNEITNYTVDFGEGTFTVSYGGLTSEPIPYSKDAKPEAKVTGIKAEPTELNVPYANTVSNDEIIKFVKANVKVTATYDDESTSDVAEYEVTIADDKATITYEGFTADVTLVKETRKLELSKTEITVDEGTDKDGITAYVKANVTAKYVYSQTTAEQTIPVDELAITVNDELTEVTVEVGGESAKIAVNIKVVPNFVETVKADTNAYGIATAKLVIFTDVKDGKVVKVTDEKGTYDAIYMGNGKWAAVVTGSYTAFADNGSLPEAAKFGRLHDASMITAYDALLTLLKANNGAVNVFDNDYQKYLLADVDGNGTLTADEALYINRISLGNADESTLWFNK